MIHVSFERVGPLTPNAVCSFSTHRPLFYNALMGLVEPSFKTPSSTAPCIPPYARRRSLYTHPDVQSPPPVLRYTDVVQVDDLITRGDIEYKRLLKALENNDTQELENITYLFDLLDARELSNLLKVACAKSARAVALVTTGRRRFYLSKIGLIKLIDIACQTDSVDVLQLLGNKFRAELLTLHETPHDVKWLFEPLCTVFVNSARGAYDWLAQNNLGLDRLPLEAHLTRQLLLDYAMQNNDEYLVSKVTLYNDSVSEPRLRLLHVNIM